MTFLFRIFCFIQSFFVLTYFCFLILFQFLHAKLALLLSSVLLLWNRTPGFSSRESRQSSPKRFFGAVPAERQWISISFPDEPLPKPFHNNMRATRELRSWIPSSRNSHHNLDNYQKRSCLLAEDWRTLLSSHHYSSSSLRPSRPGSPASPRPADRPLGWSWTEPQSRRTFGSSSRALGGRWTSRRWLWTRWRGEMNTTRTHAASGPKGETRINKMRLGRS